MISTSRLSESLDGDLVIFDKHGNPLDREIPANMGPAVLLVLPVTDAVKRLEEDVVESLDRDQMWLVEGIALRRDVLERFEGQDVSAEEMLSAVPAMGYSWQIIPFSALERRAGEDAASP